MLITAFCFVLNKSSYCEHRIGGAGLNVEIEEAKLGHIKIQPGI